MTPFSVAASTTMEPFAAASGAPKALAPGADATALSGAAKAPVRPERTVVARSPSETLIAAVVDQVRVTLIET